MSKPAEPLRTQATSGDEPPRAQPVAHAIALSELDGARGEPEHANGVHRPPGPLASALGELPHPLLHLKAQLTVCVGSAELTVAELLGAAEQQILRLDRTVDQPVDVLLDGQVVARGTLVAVDECFGVRITELPLSLDGAPALPRKP